MENNSAYWLDIVDYDLATAEAMYSTGRWLYVGFMCHQVIEKVLKAYWCGTRDDDPPYTHNPEIQGRVISTALEGNVP